MLARDGTAFGPPLGEEWLRITTRSAADNARVMDALRSIQP